MEKEKEEKELPLDQTNVRPKALNVFGLRFKKRCFNSAFQGWRDTHAQRERERGEKKGKKKTEIVRMKDR